MRKSVFVLFTALALLCAVGGIVSAESGTDVSAAASVTTSLTYQGTLTDSSGNPLTGTGTMTFRLYDVASGGSALATDSHPVTITRGLFTTPISLNSNYFDGRALWLGVQLGSDPEMTPRQEIRPVLYALSLRPGAKILTTDAGTSLNPLPGITISTPYKWNPGILIFTDGLESNGVDVWTYGSFSEGVVAITSGSYSDGVDVWTHGEGSDGVDVETVGVHSYGVVAETSGYHSYGVVASTFGADSYGVYGYSDQSIGVYADTNNPSSYGIYTNDRLYAGGGVFPTADVAEYMPVVEYVAPGTVLVIGDDGKLQVTSTAYDTRVAGIVSTLPGISLGAKESGNEGEQIIAVAGRVPCKVDALNGPIHPGDLLTTSDNPGYAMKAEPIEVNGHTFYPSGIVLGKAIGTLEAGTGIIEVLVTLQ